MEKNIKKMRIISYISYFITVLIFTWFSLLPGLRGTLNWHYLVLNIYITLFILSNLPLVLIIINLCKNNKITARISSIYSIVFACFWILVFIALNIIPSKKIDTNGINFFRSNEALPLNQSKSEDGLLAHYAFGSDPHWGSGNSNGEARINIMKQVRDQNYDAFFVLGDITEVGMMPSMYEEAVTDIKNSLGNTKFFAIPGNHDFIVNGKGIFKRTFMQKKDKMYFRIDNGSVHFIFLFILWDDAEFSKKQEKWLVKQLESIPQDETVVVFSHCYVTGSGYYDDSARKNWGDIPGVVNRVCPILEKYNVDLVLTGHNHFFELLEKNDVEYLILGSMGGKLDENLIYTSPYSKWINNDTFGYVDMKIYKDKINIEFISQNGESKFNHSVSTK